MVDDNDDGFPKKKIVFDNVHGYIDLYEPEVEIINSELFQRLRGINQLGMAHLVYPGATHTRFIHSLGVMHVITQMMEALCINKPSRRQAVHYRRTATTLNKIPIEEDTFYYFTIRMAALVHDIGHLPFSHTLEKTYVKIFKPETPQVSAHEFFSAQLVDFPTIKAVLEKPAYAAYNFNKEIIKGMITGELGNCPKRYVQLLHSNFDADRIDYLLRDSYSTGLIYGKIDLDRIFKHLRILHDNGDYIIAVNEKAAMSVDQYLLGRYYMYSTVYYHKTNFSFEEMLRKIVKKGDFFGKLPPRKDDAWLDGEDPLPSKDAYLGDIRAILKSQLAETIAGKVDLVAVYCAISDDHDLDERAKKRIEKELCRFTDHYLWNAMYTNYITLQSSAEAGTALNPKEQYLMELYPLLFARRPIKIVWESSSLLEQVAEDSWDGKINMLKETLRMTPEIKAILQKPRTLVRILNENPILDPIWVAFKRGANSINNGQEAKTSREDAKDFLKNIFFFKENEATGEVVVKSIYDVDLSILKTISKLYKYHVQIFSYGLPDDTAKIKELIDKLNLDLILRPALKVKGAGIVPEGGGE